MPFDPAFPPTSAALVSASFRDQFNSLKDLIDAQALLISDLQGANDALQDQVNDLTAALPTAIAGTANNVNGVPELVLTISDPPTQGEVLAVFDKLNELLNGLYR